MSDQAPIRVLIAEDEPETRELYTNLLTSQGHEVIGIAANGREAVERTRELHPDVLLMDVHMPESTGIEAARTLADEDTGVAIILLSGDQELAASEVAQSGAITFLAKPVHGRALDSAIRLGLSNARKAHGLRGDVATARADAASARAEVEARKLIERAKGILMNRTRCSEQDAYRILQRTSQDKSMPMVDVARAVIRSEPGATPPREDGPRG